MCSAIKPSSQFFCISADTWSGASAITWPSRAIILYYLKALKKSYLLKAKSSAAIGLHLRTAGLSRSPRTGQKPAEGSTQHCPSSLRSDSTASPSGTGTRPAAFAVGTQGTTSPAADTPRPPVAAGPGPLAACSAVTSTARPPGPLRGPSPGQQRPLK